MSDSATILIVDDDPVKLCTMDKILTPFYNVRAANSGARALAISKTNPLPDLILLDIHMTDMDGYSLLSSLKETASTLHIPVICITATEIAEDEEKGLNLGAVDFIRNPINPAVLLARVKTHLLLKQSADFLHDKNLFLEAEVKRRLQEFKYEKALLRTLLDSSPDIIFYKDQQSHYLGCNKAAEEILGYIEQEVVGKTDFDLFDHELASFFREKDQSMLRSDQPQRNEEWVEYPDGRRIMLDTLKIPFHIDKGENQGVLGISRDITERFIFQQKLTEANDALEKRVLERTKELSETNESLKELDQLKSSFIASMSHELKTPLNTIIGFSSILLEGISGSITDEQQDHVSRVYRAGEHLNTLVSDILDISKIEAGKLEIECNKVNIIELSNELYKSLQLQFQQKKLNYQQNIPTNLSISTDRRRLYQCLINLMTNAIKYSQHGTISLNVKALSNTIEFSVTDQGIGIDTANKPLLFNAFTQIDPSSDNQEQGSGLGLYLTKKLVVDVLKGEINVESELNQGSTFTILLPKELNVNPSFSQQYP